MGRPAKADIAHLTVLDIVGDRGVYGSEKAICSTYCRRRTR